MGRIGDEYDLSFEDDLSPFAPWPTSRDPARIQALSWEEGPFVAGGLTPLQPATERDEVHSEETLIGAAVEGDEEWGDDEFYDERAPFADEEALPLEPPVLFEGDQGERDWTSVESERDVQIPAAIAEFATGLGVERAQHSKRSASDEETDLLQDYRDTLEGARARWGKRYGKAPLTVEAIGRAWMISRQEETRFLYSSALNVNRLQNFAPPHERIALIQHPLVQSSDRAPVAPVVGGFVEELHRRYPGMTADNYSGHGGGAFSGRGHSLDLRIKGRDSRGFYRPDDAVDFLRAVHEAAGAVNTQWRVIYNDSSVADTINRTTRQRNVIFIGTVRRDKSKRVKGLNWHGPDPLILHFHLDLAPRVGVPNTAGSPRSQPSVSTPLLPPPRKPEAERVRFAQRVLNAAEGERLKVDGDLGPRTRGALDRFRKRQNLVTGGVLDAKTELALAQRALEELAQQSLFGEPGVRDANTDQALLDFKAQRGLEANAVLDAATRAALADAVERRAAPVAPTAAPAGAVTNWAGVPSQRRMAYVVKLLIQRYGYPEDSAAAIVGNLWEESAVLPNRIEGSKPATPMRACNFSDALVDFTAEQVMNRNEAAKRGPCKPGIGLAQWTSASRRAGLFKHRFQGRTIGAAILENMDAQVDYLVSELGSTYNRIDTLLRNPSTSLEAASDEIVYRFEIPSSVLNPPRTRPRLRPRDHPSVQRVFMQRRDSSRTALQAYRAAHPEGYVPSEESEDEQSWTELDEVVQEEALGGEEMEDEGLGADELEEEAAWEEAAWSKTEDELGGMEGVLGQVSELDRLSDEIERIGLQLEGAPATEADITNLLDLGKEIGRLGRALANEFGNTPPESGHPCPACGAPAAAREDLEAAEGSEFEAEPLEEDEDTRAEEAEDLEWGEDGSSAEEAWIGPESEETDWSGYETESAEAAPPRDQESFLGDLGRLLSPGTIVQRVRELLGEGLFGVSLLVRFGSGQIWNEDHLALEVLFHRQPKLRPAGLDQLSGSDLRRRLRSLAIKYRRELTSLRERVVRPIFGRPANFQIGQAEGCRIQDLRDDVRRLGPLKGGVLNGKVWYKRNAAASPRKQAVVDSIVLHHMAYNIGNDLKDYRKVGAHYAVMADGQVGQLYDDLDFLNASNGFNPRSVAIEFAGNFPTLSYHWWKDKKRTIPDRCYLTPAQIRAGRCLLATLKARLPGIRYVYAHRQSSGSRENDPGPDVWFNIGQWAIDNLNLTDRLPRTHIGSGQPIPDSWRVTRPAVVPTTATTTPVPKTAPKPAPVPVSSAATTPSGKKLVVTATVLNVRDSPSVQGARIGSLRKGDIVEWLDSSADSRWLRVRRGALIGWSAREYLAPQKVSGST